MLLRHMFQPVNAMGRPFSAKKRFCKRVSFSQRAFVITVLCPWVHWPLLQLDFVWTGMPSWLILLTSKMSEAWEKAYCHTIVTTLDRMFRELLSFRAHADRLHLGNHPHLFRPAACLRDNPCLGAVHWGKRANQHQILFSDFWSTHKLFPVGALVFASFEKAKNCNKIWAHQEQDSCLFWNAQWYFLKGQNG